MAIDFNGALTLADQAVLSNDPVVKEITMSLHQTWNAIKDIPFYTSPSLRQIGVRYTNEAGTIPTPTWSAINGEPNAVKGKPKSYEEQMYLIRNKITVDSRLLDQPNNIIDPVEAQVKIFMEGFAYDFNDKYINNDPTSATAGNSPDCFPGLKYRLEHRADYDIPSDCLVAPASTSASLDTTSSYNALEANGCMSAIQELFDNLNSPDGSGIVLYMNEDTKRRFEFVIRALGAGTGFNTDVDAFDRSVETYKGAKIRTVGRKLDGTTAVIAAPSNFADIYAVRYGTGYVQGWQSGPFRPEYLGKSKENGIMHNVLFDWGMGLWMPNTRSIGRLRLATN
jgi:hypothetical protein